MVQADFDWRIRTEVPAIELIDVHTEIEATRVLQGVNFGVEPGKITALIGPSGAGKTTCLRTIVGLMWPSRGDVLVNGKSTLAMGQKERLATSRQFGVLLQGAGVYGSALWDSMTVAQNVETQLRAQAPKLSDPEVSQRCAERLAEVGLLGAADRLPETLSSGGRRRLALARALVADPPFVVLDSFELGADPVTLSRLITLVQKRQQESGGAFLVATQSMDVVRKIADDVIVLWNGRVLKEGPAQEILDSDEDGIRQLLDGSTEGPLTMAPDNLRLRRAPRKPLTPPGELGFEVPAPLIGFGMLAIITLSAVFLGGANPVELGILAAVWGVSLRLAFVRERNRRRRYER